MEVYYYDVYISYIVSGNIHCRYLHYSFTDAVRSQDTLYVVRHVASNIHGRSITWNFLRNNWPILQERYVHMYIDMYWTICVLCVNICLYVLSMWKFLLEIVLYLRKLTIELNWQLRSLAEEIVIFLNGFYGPSPE